MAGSVEGLTVKRFTRMTLSNSKKSKRSFTLFEMLITIVIITIVTGSMVSMQGAFNRRQQLMVSALRLVNDLRLAQQCARTRKNIYNFYGLKFYSGLGPNADRVGYKIVRYNPSGVTVTSINGLSDFGIIKSSVAADSPPAEWIENTYFDLGIQMDATSHFKVGAPDWPSGKPNAVVFTPNGSATFDGSTLLDSSNNLIILSRNQYKVTVEIVPLTGYIEVY